MLIGLTRIRNEAEIIQDTLTHWGRICNGGIFVYDDLSQDSTVAICKAHPSVRKIIKGRDWDSNRPRAEFENRQSVLEEALKIASEVDWFVYFDADEFLYNFDKSILTNQIDGVKCRLFDIYITQEDIDRPYKERQYVGPEYRDILFFFRQTAIVDPGYKHLDQRECSLESGSRIIQSGIIKHFGKGFSLKQWENACEYYIKYFPLYAQKWAERKGQGIHKVSDFGAPLIKFSQILEGVESGYLLEIN